MSLKDDFLKHVKTRELQNAVNAMWSENPLEQRSPVRDPKKLRHRINPCLETFNRLPKTLASGQYVGYHKALYYYFAESHPPHMLFWRPSFIGRDRRTTIFLNNPLFFKDNRNEGAIIRHLSVNEWGEEESLSRALERLQVGSAFRKAYPQLEEANVYLMRGEVEARDHLFEWLRKTCPEANIDCHYRSAHASLVNHHCVLIRSSPNK